MVLIWVNVNRIRLFRKFSDFDFIFDNFLHYGEYGYEIWRYVHESNKPVIILVKDRGDGRRKILKFHK